MPKYRQLTPRMIVDFCKVRMAHVLEADDVLALSDYLVGLLELMAFPPYCRKWIDWSEVAAAKTEIAVAALKAARHQLQPIFDALSRAVAMEDAQVVRTQVWIDRTKPAHPASDRSRSTGPGDIIQSER